MDTLNSSLDRFEFIPSDSGINSIVFTIEDESYPKESSSEDESYNLVIDTDIQVKSKTILGAINAITTLNQLLDCDGISCSIPNGPFNITD